MLVLTHSSLDFCPTVASKLADSVLSSPILATTPMSIPLQLALHQQDTRSSGIMTMLLGTSPWALKMMRIRPFGQV